MRAANSILLVTGAVALAAAAPKPDTATGTNIPGVRTSQPVYTMGGAPTDWASAELSPPPETRPMVQKFGDCVVRKHPSEAATIILQDLPNEEIIKKYPALRDWRCMEEAEKSAIQLRFPGDSFRYAIAEALVKAQPPQPISQMRTVPPLLQRAHDPTQYSPQGGSFPKPRNMSKKAYREWLERGRLVDEGQAFARRFGECAVRADLIDSYRLLFTQPESPEENAAIAALVPDLRKCVPTGDKLVVNVHIVRGTIAVNYYRLAHAARAGSQQVAKP